MAAGEKDGTAAEAANAEVDLCVKSRAHPTEGKVPSPYPPPQLQEMKGLMTGSPPPAAPPRRPGKGRQGGAWGGVRAGKRSCFVSTEEKQIKRGENTVDSRGSDAQEER